MTQHALAEELGTVREVVARELRQLRREGVLVGVGRSRYRAPDLDRLRALVRPATA
jgi:biotin operon repressor